jgi:hypothetical protein
LEGGDKECIYNSDEDTSWKTFGRERRRWDTGIWLDLSEIAFGDRKMIRLTRIAEWRALVLEVSKFYVVLPIAGE